MVAVLSAGAGAAGAAGRLGWRCREPQVFRRLLRGAAGVAGVAVVSSARATDQPRASTTRR